MEEITSSPRWNASTKLVVALTLVAVVAGLLIKFESILPPLILVTILAYLLNPVASFLCTKLRVPWRLAVSLIYAVMIITLLALLTVGGVGLVQQVQSLIRIVQQNLENVPTMLAELSLRPFVEQLLGIIQPVIGQSGVMVGAIAGGAANVLGWAIFVLLVSYFVMLEGNSLGRGFLEINIPGHENDLRRMSSELGYIWNAFLRGQILIMALATVIYFIVLSALGVNYALGLALLAGLARFVPYLGSFTAWSTLFLVTIFQSYKPFDLSPWMYALIVVGIAWLIDMIVDNLVAPRIMAQALKVHPAAVLVATLVGFGLLGILGIIIAAPLLATLQLIGRYFVRKLFDLDPWEGLTDARTRLSVEEELRIWFAGVSKKLRISRS
jgi:predicted PurR-regulated permease PerM